MKVYVKPNESIMDKIKDVPQDDVLEIILSEGVYEEKVRIHHPKIIVRGVSNLKTVITNQDYAYKMHDDGLLYNTFRTYTAMFISDELELHHLTIKNNCGSGFTIGQGVALSLLAKKSYISSCRFLGHQDTLFIGPLPKDLNERYDHFLPEEERSDEMTYHHFERCYIEGDVDYIFGSGTAYFEQCEIVSLNKGYITAPSTYENAPYGFIFDQCIIKNQSDSFVYLGRPWREYGASLFRNCTFDGLFDEKRFDAWDKSHMRFYEHPYHHSLLSKPLSDEYISHLNQMIKTHFKKVIQND